MKAGFATLDFDLSAYSSWDLKQTTDDELRVTYGVTLSSSRPYRYGHGSSTISINHAFERAQEAWTNYGRCK